MCLQRSSDGLRLGIHPDVTRSSMNRKRGLRSVRGDGWWRWVGRVVEGGGGWEREGRQDTRGIFKYERLPKAPVWIVIVVSTPFDLLPWNHGFDPVKTSVWISPIFRCKSIKRVQIKLKLSGIDAGIRSKHGEREC